MSRIQMHHTSKYYVPVVWRHLTNKKYWVRCTMRLSEQTFGNCQMKLRTYLQRLAGWPLCWPYLVGRVTIWPRDQLAALQNWKQWNFSKLIIIIKRARSVCIHRTARKCYLFTLGSNISSITTSKLHQNWFETFQPRNVNHMKTLLTGEAIECVQRFTGIHYYIAIWCHCDVLLLYNHIST